MSIKTLRKRIALVAVSALAVTGFSTVSANAAASGWTVFTSNVTSINLKQATSAPTANGAVYVNIGAVTSANNTAAANATSAKVMQFRAALTSYPAGGYVTVAGSLNVEGATAGTATAVTNGTTAVVATGITGASAGNSIFIKQTDEATNGFGGNTITATSTGGIGSFVFTPTVAGTYVMSVWNDHPASGATTIGNGNIDISEAQQTITLTVAAEASYSNTLSTAYITPGLGGTGADFATNPAIATADVAVNASSAMAAAARASITVKLFDSTNTAMAAGKVSSITGEITGPGGLKITADNTPTAPTCSTTATAPDGRSVTFTSEDEINHVYVCADGTAGEATISIYVTDLAGVKNLLATKKVTFYSLVSKLEVSTKVRTILRSGGYWQSAADSAANLRDRSATNVPSVVVKMTDSAGRLANSSAEPTVVSGNSAVIASGACGLDDGLDTTYSSGAGVGYYNCGFQSATSSKSGDKATVTIRIVDPLDSTKYITTTVELTIGGVVAKETLSFDKASYAPGEAMILTLTAVDASGNPVYDGAASPSISFTKAVGGTSPTTSTYNAGKKASSTSAATAGVFAPVTSGAFSATATSGNAASDTITASATVANPIDAQIASLVAAIAKLQKAINKINKRLAR